MPNLTSDMCSSFYGENTNCTTRLRSPLKKDPQIRPKTTLKLCELHYVVTKTPKQTTKWGRKNTQRSSAKLEGKCIWFFLGWLRGRQEIRKAIGENEASLDAIGHWHDRKNKNWKTCKLCDSRNISQKPQAVAQLRIWRIYGLWFWVTINERTISWGLKVLRLWLLNSN